MNNPILKYVMKTTKDEVVHSSAYGVAQNAGGVGVASTQSFDERMNIEKNRQNVKKYNDSQIASHMYEGARAKTYTPPEKEEPKYGPRRVEMKTQGIRMNKSGMAGNKSGAAGGRPGAMVVKPGIVRGK